MLQVEFIYIFSIYRCLLLFSCLTLDANFSFFVVGRNFCFNLATNPLVKWKNQQLYWNWFHTFVKKGVNYLLKFVFLSAAQKKSVRFFFNRKITFFCWFLSPKVIYLKVIYINISRIYLFINLLSKKHKNVVKALYFITELLRNMCN